MHPECWSAGQFAAFQDLLEIAKTFFEFDSSLRSLGPLRGRFDSLVVGASGVGKSHLLRALSRHLSVPLLRVSWAEWIVAASRESPHTLERIYLFVQKNPRGLIHIDELDKFRASFGSDWSVSVMVEVFLLLDRSLHQPLRDLIWTEEMQEKLANQFLIFGTGTWQSVWEDVVRPSVGFGASPNRFKVEQEIIKRGVIPAELLRRFRSKLIILPPPTETDYRHGAQLFGLETLATRVGVALDYESAVEQGTGARWLEERLADLLCEARRKGISPMITRLEELFADDTDPDFELTDFPE